MSVGHGKEIHRKVVLQLEKRKKIHLVAAARPNFMKIAPLYHALRAEDWAEPIIVHTGQHYDLGMSEAFLKDLKLPEPNIQLGVGSGTHAEQTGRVMIEYERVLMESLPDLVVVVGDVNSTAAATLAATKLGVKIGHLEAGLRSFDRTMPEEINRVVTDTLADLLWTPSHDAEENLLRQGITRERINRVGNIMIDSLEMLRDCIEELAVYREFGLTPKRYGVVTLHRPANVDPPNALEELSRVLSRISEKIPIVFPIHPRTRKNLELYGLLPLAKNPGGLHLTEPLSYISFMNLVFNCTFVITDSGGLQQETTYLGIPCITVRPNTEWPITLSQGTNRLCHPNEIEPCVDRILAKNQQRGSVPELWDGSTAGRVVRSIRHFLLH